MAIEGLEILMSKLHHCTQLLAHEGVEADLIGGLDGELPLLLVYFPQGDAQLTCLPVDNDGSMTRFVWNFTVQIDLPDAAFLQKQTVCDLFDEESLAGFAYLAGDGGAIVYRQVLPEVAMPVSDEVFLYFARMYAEYLGVLHAFIADVIGG